MLPVLLVWLKYIFTPSRNSCECIKQFVIILNSFVYGSENGKQEWAQTFLIHHFPLYCAPLNSFLSLNWTKSIYVFQLCEKFTAEKDNLKDEARSEIKSELQSINKEHEMEIQRIYSRVQQAIQKKDATLETLQKENSALRERNLKLDAIIRQQRKDYCTKWYFLSDIWR